jgi:hypothetical protein
MESCFANLSPSGSFTLPVSTKETEKNLNFFLFVSDLFGSVYMSINYFFENSASKALIEDYQNSLKV